MGCVGSQHAKAIEDQRASKRTAGKRQQHITNTKQNEDIFASIPHISSPSEHSSNSYTTASSKHPSDTLQRTKSTSANLGNSRVILKKKHNNTLVPLSSFLSSALLSHNAKHLSNGRPVECEFALENMTGALLFLDISGFTNLFHKTASFPNGAETMTQHVNAYFAILLETVVKHGGDVEKWAGDAMMVMFYHSDLKQATLKALECALEIQQSANLMEYSVDDVRLTLHCAVTSGTFHCFHVGGVNNEWKRILTGKPMDNLEEAVSLSQKGEVTVSRSTLQLVQNHVAFTSLVNSDCVLVNKVLQHSTYKIPKPLLLSNSMEAAMRCFVDANTIEKIEAQQIDNNLLSSIKNCTMVFITLSIKNQTILEQNSQMLSLLQKHVHRVQSIIQPFEGCICNFLADEKGILIALCFGHPVTHTNDAYRAVAAAYKIETFLREDQQFEYGIGVATGDTFVGAVGDEQRRDFTTISAATNLAARLMKSSQSQHSSRILCDETTMTKASIRFDFENLQPIQLKGYSKPQPLFKVLREKDTLLFTHNRLCYENRTIREKELKQITDIIEAHLSQDVAAQQPPVILVKKHGPGVGCTHMLRVLMGMQEQFSNAQLHYHALDDVRQIPFELFVPWVRHAVLLRLLQDEPNLAEMLTEATPISSLTYAQLKSLFHETPAEKKKEIIRFMLQSMPNAADREFSSLLNSLLEVDFMPSPKLKELSKEERTHIAIRIITHFLNFLFSEAFSNTFVVALWDDFHVADAGSVDAFLECVKKGQDAPSLCRTNTIHVVCVDTTLIDAHLLTRLEDVVQHTVHLDHIPEEQIEGLIVDAVRGHNLHPKSVDRRIVEFVSSTACADVSRAEVAVQMMLENLLMEVGNNSLLQFVEDRMHMLESLDVPSSLSLIIQQRLDHLDANSALVLKVASVIGVHFSYETLAAVFPTHVVAYDNLRDHLETVIETGTFVVRTDQKTYDGKSQYAFVTRHVRDTVHNSLLQSVKQRKHGDLATYYVRNYNLRRVTSQFTQIEKKNTAIWNELLWTAEHYSLSQCTVCPTPYSDDAIALIKLVIRELEVMDLFPKAMQFQLRLLSIIEHREDKDGRSRQLKVEAYAHIPYIQFSSQLTFLPETQKPRKEAIEKGLALSQPGDEQLWDLYHYAWWDSYLTGNHETSLGFMDKFDASCKGYVEEYYFCICYALTNYAIAHFTEVEQYRNRAAVVIAEYGVDNIMGHQAMGHFEHDLLTNLIIFHSRAQYFLGKQKSAKRSMFEADQIQEKLQHGATTRFVHLFNMYLVLLRQDYAMLLELCEKMEQAPQKDDHSKRFYFSMSACYRHCAQFMICEEKSQFGELFESLKKAFAGVINQNQVFFVGYIECVLKYAQDLRHNAPIRALTELAAVDALIHDHVLKGKQEHTKGELFRLYADVLVLRMMILIENKDLEIDEVLEVGREIPRITDIVTWFERTLSLCASQLNLTTTLKIYVSMWRFYSAIDDETAQNTALNNLVKCLQDFDEQEIDLEIPFMREAYLLIEQQRRLCREFLLLVKCGDRKVKLQLNMLKSLNHLKQEICRNLELEDGIPMSLTYLDEDFGEDVDLVQDVGVLPSKAVISVHLGN